MSASPPLFVKITIARLGLFERALVDTGATMTLIRENLARPLLNYLEVNTKPAFITADGRRAECLGTLPLSIRHGIFEICLERVAVVPSLPYDLILGRDWLARSGASIDFSLGVGQLKFPKPKAIPVVLSSRTLSATDHLDQQSPPVPVANSPPQNPKLESIKEESELLDGLAAIQVDEGETDGGRLRCQVVSRTTVPPNCMCFLPISSATSFSVGPSGGVMLEKCVSSFPGREWVTPASLLTSLDRRTLFVPILNVSDSPIIFQKGEPFSARICESFRTVSSIPGEEMVIGICETIDPCHASSVTNIDLRERLERDVKFGRQLSKRDQDEVMDILASVPSCFSDESGLIGRTDFVQHEIDTGTSLPVHSAPYRVSATERKVIAEQVSEMEAAGVVRPSVSPWSSPVVLTKRSDGRLTFCVDYRRLNDKTRKDVSLAYG